MANWTSIPCEHDNGPARNATIGLIVLAGDMAIEPEVSAFLPDDGVGLYVTRIPIAKAITPETVGEMEGNLTNTAKLLLPEDKLDVIAFGCASCTMTIGEDRVAELIRSARPDIAVTDAITAGIQGMRHLGIRRIALVTPWIESLSEGMAAYLHDRGFDIVTKGCFQQPTNPEICRVSPQSVYDGLSSLDYTDVDALFVAGTGLRVSAVLGELEATIGKPVVTSNQALAWHSLRLAGYDRPVEGYGHLMAV